MTFMYTDLLYIEILNTVMSMYIIIHQLY